MTVGNRIREKRLELGLSVEELASMLGKNRATVYRYENGDIENMPTSLLEPIAKALHTTPSYLMGWEPEETKSTEPVCPSLGLDDRTQAFYFQLRSLGWSYEWSETEQLYLLSNGMASVKITVSEYQRLMEQSECFFRKELQKLILRSSALEPQAAHERTDISVTEEMIRHDDMLMDDDNIWK